MSFPHLFDSSSYDVPSDLSCLAMAIFSSRSEERYSLCSSAYFRGTGRTSLNNHCGKLNFSKRSTLFSWLGITSWGSRCGRSGQRTSLKINTPSRLIHPQYSGWQHTPYMFWMKDKTNTNILNCQWGLLATSFSFLETLYLICRPRLICYIKSLIVVGSTRHVGGCLNQYFCLPIGHLELMHHFNVMLRETLNLANVCWFQNISWMIAIRNKLYFVEMKMMEHISTKLES